MSGVLQVGGARQRADAAAALRAAQEPARRDDKSKLAETLLLLFGWGLLTSTCCQWIAQSAVEDGMTHADLLKLASIGCEGRYAGNCRRDLLSKFASALKTAFFTTIWVPMLDRDGSIEDRKFVMHAPNRLFEALY